MFYENKVNICVVFVLYQDRRHVTRPRLKSGDSYLTALCKQLNTLQYFKSTGNYCYFLQNKSIISLKHILCVYEEKSSSQLLYIYKSVHVLIFHQDLWWSFYGIWWMMCVMPVEDQCAVSTFSTRKDFLHIAAGNVLTVYDFFTFVNIKIINS